MVSDEIRKKIKQNDLYIWQVAMECGVSEPQFYRWLRDPNNKRETIENAIDNLVQKRKIEDE